MDEKFLFEQVRQIAEISFKVCKEGGFSLEDAKKYAWDEIYKFVNVKKLDYETGLRISGLVGSIISKHYGENKVVNKDDLPLEVHNDDQLLKHSLNDLFQEAYEVSIRRLKLQGLSKDEVMEESEKEIKDKFPSLFTAENKNKIAGAKAAASTRVYGRKKRRKNRKAVKNTRQELAVPVVEVDEDKPQTQVTEFNITMWGIISSFAKYGCLPPRDGLKRVAIDHGLKPNSVDSYISRIAQEYTLIQQDWGGFVCHKIENKFENLTVADIERLLNNPEQRKAILKKLLENPEEFFAL